MSLSKPSVRNKCAFCLHEGQFFWCSIFEFSGGHAVCHWVIGRRPGSALAIWMFSGCPGLAIGCPDILRWGILAQDDIVFMGYSTSLRIISSIICAFPWCKQNLPESIGLQRRRVISRLWARPTLNIFMAGQQRVYLLLFLAFPSGHSGLHHTGLSHVWSICYDWPSLAKLHPWGHKFIQIR